MSSMLIANRGVSDRIKGVKKDISRMMKVVEESQFDLKERLTLLSSYMDVNECDTTIFFEGTKRMERLWIASEKRSIRFTILDAVSTYELCSPVNYHKHAGHVLLFSEDFAMNEQLSEVKKMLTAVFAVDDSLPVERALCFYYVDGRICIRNYVCDGVQEVGPRLDLELDKILDGCFKGEVLYNRRNNKLDN